MIATPERTTPTSITPAVRRSLRIGFVANRYMDPRLVGSWSGIPYHFARSLAGAGCEIVPIYDLREPAEFPRKVRQAWWRYARNAICVTWSRRCCARTPAKSSGGRGRWK